jgi:hypothetical protein
MVMVEQVNFQGLSKLPKTAIGVFCQENRIKIDKAIVLDPAISIVDALFVLYQTKAMAEFFQVLTSALPSRERVWFACLAARDMQPEGEEKSEAILAAEAWVFKPNVKTRAAVQKVIEDADMDDPTVLAADAAFHGITPDQKEIDKSPPTASPAMVFGAVLQSLYEAEGDDELEINWNSLVARGLNIAAGGNGKTGA